VRGGLHPAAGIGRHLFFRLGRGVYRVDRGQHVRVPLWSASNRSASSLSTSFTISPARSRPRYLSEALTSIAMSMWRRVFSLFRRRQSPAISEDHDVGDGLDPDLHVHPELPGRDLSFLRNSAFCRALQCPARLRRHGLHRRSLKGLAVTVQGGVQQTRLARGSLNPLPHAAPLLLGF
jgi:hypothetical protein